MTPHRDREGADRGLPDLPEDLAGEGGPRGPNAPAPRPRASLCQGKNGAGPLSLKTQSSGDQIWLGRPGVGEGGAAQEEGAG